MDNSASFKPTDVIDCENIRKSSTISNSHNKKDEKLLFILSFITFTFICIELVAGYLSHSLAIMTDAFHLLTDLLTFSTSIIAMRLARKSPTNKYKFGFYRAEILAALFSVLTIWVLTGMLFYAGITRILNSDYEVDAKYMLITSIIGILFNIIIVILIFVGDKNHGNHCKKSGTSNLNIKAALIHAAGDLLQSVSVTIAAIIIYYTKYSIADTISTFIIGIVILMTTFPITKNIIEILMESAPSEINYNEYHSRILSIPGVEKAELRIWSLKSNMYAISIKFDVYDNKTYNEIAMKIESLLKTEEIFKFICFEI